MTYQHQYVNGRVIDLPMGMPKDVFKDLKKTWVSGRQLGITRMADTSEDHKTNTQRTSKKMTDKKKTDRKTKKKKGRARKPADSDKA